MNLIRVAITYNTSLSLDIHKPCKQTNLISSNNYKFNKKNIYIIFKFELFDDDEASIFLQLVENRKIAEIRAVIINWIPLIINYQQLFNVK